MFYENILWSGSALLITHSFLPNSKAYWVKTINGVEVKRTFVETDSLGFRTSEKCKQPSNKYLFLGCSFSFGAYADSDSTFSHLLSQEFDADYINAGVSAYGLAQMNILAEELIPKYKPDYVFVQYTPWLYDRAVSMYAPTYRNTIRPFPYVSRIDGAIQIIPPLFC